MDLTNEEWQLIAKYIPKPKAQPGKLRRPTQYLRVVLNGVLWLMKTCQFPRNTLRIHISHKEHRLTGKMRAIRQYQIL
jgi:hypothetical protein